MRIAPILHILFILIGVLGVAFSSQAQTRFLTGPEISATLSDGTFNTSNRTIWTFSSDGTQRSQTMRSVKKSWQWTASGSWRVQADAVCWQSKGKMTSSVNREAFEDPEACSRVAIRKGRLNFTKGVESDKFWKWTLKRAD